MLKNKFDYHVHTSFSNDSETPMQSVIESAIEEGITELCFTDHVDFDYDDEAKNVDWIFDVEDYFKTIEAFRLQYRDKINLKTGVEFGVQPHLKERMDQFVGRYDFDFVLASQHTVDRTDLYYQKYFQGKTDFESVRHYYEMYNACAKMSDQYSVLGHLDLYVRYKKDLVNHDVHQHFDILEDLFKHLAYNGKGIEVNAGGYKYGLGVNNPTPDILKFYKACGGEIITLGSDAHTTDYLGTHFEDNIEMLKALGFKYITSYDKMKPHFHAIDKL